MNDTHRRALQTSLRVIETYLGLISEDLTRSETRDNYSLSRIINDIDDATKQELIQDIDLMLREISEMKEKFHLQIRSDSIASQTRSRLGDIWIILEELRPAQFSNYGKMSEEDTKELDPHVLFLLQVTNQARTILKRETAY